MRRNDSRPDEGGGGDHLLPWPTVAEASSLPLKERFNQLFRLSKWTDCTFRVGHNKSELIEGHKLVLGVGSPVFEALFHGALAPAASDAIVVPDIEPSVFRKLLQYLYCDEVELVSICEAGQVLYAAKKYLVTRLAEHCEDYLLSHIWLRNLWAVLDIATFLSEDRLINACLKVMCGYSVEVWWSRREEGDRLSPEVFCRLLERHEMASSETDLWKLAVNWAASEAVASRLSDTPQTRRQLLEESGITSRLKVLLIDPDSLAPELTQEEIRGLREDGEVPQGFSRSRELRRQASPGRLWKWTPTLRSRKNLLWVNCGEVVCKISSAERVLVVGFEVRTRLAQPPIFFSTRRASTYREKLFVSIQDPEGNLLHRTDYEASVEFDSSQAIHLKQPVWFDGNHSTQYVVRFGYISGQYPSSHWDFSYEIPPINYKEPFSYNEAFVLNDGKGISEFTRLQLSIRSPPKPDFWYAYIRYELPHINQKESFSYNATFVRNCIPTQIEST